MVPYGWPLIFKAFSGEGIPLHEEDEDEVEQNDNRNSNIEESRADRAGFGGIGNPGGGGHGNGNNSDRRRSDRRKRSDNPDKVMAPPSNGGTGIPPGMVGGPSLKATMEKDELNHIIPESKKFPQVGPCLFLFFYHD